jgi:aldehyde dehydrogenase (NAD+)
VTTRYELELRWTHVDDLYIDGTWTPSTGTARAEVVDPATEAMWGSVPDATPEDVQAAMTAAHRAFRSGPWPAMIPSERGPTTCAASPTR